MLYGRVNPSGRLPYSIAKQWDDYPDRASTGATAEYHEGLAVGYRWFDQQEIAPNFEFGFGLSYTSFHYRNLDVTVAQQGADDPRVRVSVDVYNDGRYDGSEVPQLYLTFPKEANEPPKVLRGFEKVFINRGGKANVQFELGRDELTYWDDKEHTWVVPQGDFVAHVGASSRDIRGTVQFSVLS